MSDDLQESHRGVREVNPGNFLKGLIKTIKSLSQDDHFPGKDPNFHDAVSTSAVTRRKRR
jgi:hypothetical protein